MISQKYRSIDIRRFSGKSCNSAVSYLTSMTQTWMCGVAKLRGKRSAKWQNMSILLSVRKFSLKR